MATLFCCCQFIPWLTPARHKPWASICGEMAETSPRIPCRHRCRGLRVVCLFKRCPEICGTIKRASSSHLERQAGNVHCAPALRQCLAVELKPVHRHSLKYCLSLLCSLMLLPCAGTRRCTKPAHLWNGSTGNCRLLGWLLSSCFSYDITAFKLQKGSISELKTHGSFHKSKGEMLAGRGVGGGHSGTAEHAEHPVSPVFC